MSENRQELFRLLPSVDALLQTPEIAELLNSWRREIIVTAINEKIAEIREGIARGAHSKKSLKEEIRQLSKRIVERIDQLTTVSFQRVINATGVVVHTNLGRSPLSQSAINKMVELAGGYLNLEFELETGRRGQRDIGVRRLLKLLFPGCEAIVVNNNAAAVLLALNTLADNREAIISRGRIIEIGDGFRINQIQEKSGAVLKEVGTTNRTHTSDFEEAITDNTALLLSVHPSNYRVVGFTTEVTLEDLVGLAEKKALPVLEDWGSGCLADPGEYGISGEESASQVLAHGPDAICFSGDKLLGGPQAGIIVGKPETVLKMRKNHLYRALRVDKLTLITLEETLRAYLHGKEDDIPILKLLGTSVDELQNRAAKIVDKLGKDYILVVKSSGRVGGGAAPEVEIPGIALEIKSGAISPDELKDKLRANDPPIIARVLDDSVLLNLRSVFPDEDEIIVSALNRLL